MKTPAGKECPHFYGDYYRGRNFEECRLLKLHNLEWTRNLCATCPVPEIALANACEHMRLTPRLVRPFSAAFQRRVQVNAHCEKTHRSVAEPQIGCGECHELPFRFEIKD